MLWIVPSGSSSFGHPATANTTASTSRAASESHGRDRRNATRGVRAGAPVVGAARFMGLLTGGAVGGVGRGVAGRSARAPGGGPPPAAPAPRGPGAPAAGEPHRRAAAEYPARGT